MIVTERKLTLVPPARQTPAHSLWNAKGNRWVPGGHTPHVYFYEPNGSPDFFDPKVLKEGLSKALVPFYPMAGRLRSTKGGIEINCNAEGVLFVEAKTTSAVDDLGNFAPQLELRKLIPAVNYSAGLSTYPLLVLQVTYFSCGGVSLGVGMVCDVADGLSGLHFIKAWSDMVRGVDFTLPSFIDRTLLRACHRPQLSYIEYLGPPPHEALLSQTTRSGAESTTVSIFLITREELYKLKGKSIRDANAANYDLCEVLAGHVWRCACKARELADEQVSKLYIATDRWDELHPPLLPDNFGHVIFTATRHTAVRDLRSEPTCYAARWIHDAFVCRDKDHLRSALDHLEHRPDMWMFVVEDHTYRCPTLGMSSWVKFPIHDIDFGWGRPIFLGPGGIAYGGLSFTLSSPANDESMSVTISLQTKHMNVFEKLLYEM